MLSAPPQRETAPSAASSRPAAEEPLGVQTSKYVTILSKGPVSSANPPNTGSNQAPPAVVRREVGTQTCPQDQPTVESEPDSIQPWLSHLELMHHYSTAACRTLPRADELPDLWQIKVPRLGMNCPYLMHQVLAIAAHHMAYLHPANRAAYLAEASRHDGSTARGLQDAIQELRGESSTVMFAAASLLVINTYASQSALSQRSISSKIDEILGIFVLTRGMNGILKTDEPLLREGPLGALLRPSLEKSNSQFLDALSQRLQQVLSNPAHEIHSDAYCQAEVNRLITNIDRAKATSSMPLMRITMYWPIPLSDSFLSLMRQRQPTALIVLGYYALVMAATGRTAWFLEKWGQTLLEDIESAIGGRHQNEELAWQMDMLRVLLA